MSTVRIQVRRGVSTGAGSWFSVNPTLAAGEIGLETDTGKFKFGNNEDPWNDLPYALANSLADYIPLSLKGNPDGVAELDAAGLIPVTQLPPLAKVTVSSVADQAARLALTAEVGDIAIQTDSGASYVLQTAGASTNDNWKELVGNEKVQDVIGAMLSGNTETGITVTYQDSDGTIDFEVADQFTTHSTSDLSEGTNLYFTTERAQDSVGNAVGTGLSYNDSTGAISVDTTAIQAVVSGVSNTEIGYLDGVTSSIQTQIDGKLSLSGGTMTGDIILSANPTNSLHPATKQYVDNVTSGINFHEAVHVASVANISTIYDNGTDGVGATLTADTNRAFSSMDGHTSFAVGNRILIKNQTDQKQNGIYTITTIGSSSVPYVLTRASDSDNNPTGEIKYGDFCLVLNGTENGSLGFVNSSTDSPIVVGTSLISYTPFNAAKAITAGLGLAEDTPGVLTIDSTVTQNDAWQTLTDKTINLSNNYISGTLAEFNSSLSDANFATISGAEQLENKTISLSSNSLSGTIAEFNASITDTNFATTDQIETLINKSIDAANNTITINTTDIVNVTASAAELNVLDGITATTSELNTLGGITANTSELNILDGVTAIAAELNVLDGITSSTAELNTLTGITVTTAELNTLDGITANVSELNILDGALLDVNELNILNGATLSTSELNVLYGITSSTSDLNKIGSVTASAAELNILTGATLSTTELNYVDGVTSSIQTQIDGKQAIVANVSDVEIGYLDGVTSAIQTQIDGKQAIVANVSDIEIGYLDGVTSAIQTQIDAKLGTSTASSTYAPIASPTFTGTVTIPAGASISGFAPLESPTFTGTVVLPSTVNGPSISTSVNLLFPTQSGHITLGGSQTTGNLTIGGGTGRTTGVIGIGTGATTTGTKTINVGTGSTGGTTAITVGSSSGATSNITLNGAVSTSGNLTVGGDLTVSGTTTTVSTANFTTEDALIYLGEGNSANLVDLGFVSSFNDGTYQHSGLARDASDSKWKLFKGVTDEPTTTVNFAQGSLDALAVGALEATSITVGSVSNTEFGYLDGVTSAIQTQIDAKAPIAAPTFTGLVTLAASGVAFTDGTQTGEGVISRTPIVQKTASYTLSALTERDSLIEVSSASGTTITIPTNTAVAYPIGTSIDILQTSTGQVTIAGDAGVTVNATPGLKLRTQWSSCTLFKRATNTWVVYGDLTA